MLNKVSTKFRIAHPLHYLNQQKLLHMTLGTSYGFRIMILCHQRCHLVFLGSKEDSPERHLGDESQHEEDPNDIFSRQSQLIRSNSSSSTVKKTSSMRRSMRPGEQSSHTSSSNLNDTNIMSPSHVSLLEQAQHHLQRCYILCLMLWLEIFSYLFN